MTRGNADRHHRRSIRLPYHDYRTDAGYFVTIVAKEWTCLFGDVVGDAVQLGTFGQIVAESWRWLAQQYTYVYLDDWVVMPNHLHGIIVISGEGYDDAGRGGSRTAPTDIVPFEKRKPLGRLIGAFKTVSTQRINALRDRHGAPMWQRNYYEHVIRGNADLDRARGYIQTNPARWAQDRENPAVWQD